MVRIETMRSVSETLTRADLLPASIKEYRQINSHDLSMQDQHRKSALQQNHFANGILSMLK